MNLDAHPETQRREVWMNTYLCAMRCGRDQPNVVADVALERYEHRFLKEWNLRKKDKQTTQPPTVYEK